MGKFLRNWKQNPEKTWIKIFIFGLSKNYPYPWIVTFETILHNCETGEVKTNFATELKNFIFIIFSIISVYYYSHYSPAVF
jgi:hypothetical protein